MKRLYLVEILSAIVEIEASNRDEAEEIFDNLIEPIAACGIVSYKMPKTEEEFERDESMEEKGEE